MLLHQFLEQWAEQTPDATALIEPTRWTTYAELDRLANGFAHLCRQKDVRRGDRVVIALENSAEMVAAYFGAMKAGAVAVPLAGGARSDRLQHAIADCAPRLCVVDAGAARRLSSWRADTSSLGGASSERPFDVVPGDLREALSTCPHGTVAAGADSGDLAAIIYTSGSTGAPRGVMLSHGNFVANTRSILGYLHLTPEDRVMCVLPFHYVYGLSLLHTHLAVGGSVVIENRSGYPNVVLESMREHEVTGFAGVPSTFALMLHRSNLDEVKLPRLRHVMQAGGAMPAAQIVDWLRRGPKADFYVMYGATEAAARLTCLPPADLLRKLGSVGRAIPGVEIVVVSETGERARPREVGEIVARGANIARGYWDNPEETAERFRDGGYRTGDLGYVDEEGYLYLVGRRHDMIKVGAHRVGAREIEDVLHQHPAVFEAAVIGAPHLLLGEAPVAFVALNTPLADAEIALRAFCTEHLAAYKVPVRIIDLSELPKLPGTGKVDRAALRAQLKELHLETAS